ncbi:hypothetical protein SNE40_009431 [Patella caerulea]|uniref:2'-5'-oligoadenylate synthetase 1 domain-containing protein n=1 Tax=Patella caerulea TaxID=87958 RepID=A0AAN8JXY5_PATCE
MASSNISRYLPGHTDGESLEKFIDRVVRPPDEFRKRMNNAVDKLVQYLHVMPGYSVSEVVKSGSLGKGTAVQDSADADMVMFINDYKTMEELKNAKPTILNDIKRYLTNPKNKYLGSKPDWLNSITVGKMTGFHINVKIHLTYNGKNLPVDIDILPAIDVIRKHEDNLDAVYAEIETKPDDIQAHYSVCFCKKQISLIRPQPAKAKDLILLLKYWKMKNDLDMRSYCCEILGLHIFKEHMNSKTNFKMREGFIKALEMLQDYQTIQIAKSSLYDSRAWRRHFPSTYYIMDPVNPFSDTSSLNIQPIRKCAQMTLARLTDETVPEDGEETSAASCVLM